jgi:uncharacterized membrane protein YtjA (UPF0391 family)
LSIEQAFRRAGNLAVRLALRQQPAAHFTSESIMLRWAIIFLIISVITGILGFTGISEATAGIAKILFYIFLVILLIWVVLIIAGVSIVT